MGYFIMGCLNRGGGPQIGEITYGGSPHLSCKRDNIKMRDYMDKWVTPPKRVSSPTWGPPPTCKQALNVATIRIETVSILELTVVLLKVLCKMTSLYLVLFT